MEERKRVQGGGPYVTGKFLTMFFIRITISKGILNIGALSIGRVFYIYLVGKTLQDNSSFQLNNVYMATLNCMWIFHYCFALDTWSAVCAVPFCIRGKTAQSLWGFEDNVYRYYIYGEYFELKEGYISNDTQVFGTEVLGWDFTIHAGRFDNVQTFNKELHYATSCFSICLITFA